MQQATQDIVKSKAADLLGLLKRYERQIQASIPKHLDVDTMLQLIVGSVNRTPDLLQCTPSSVLNSVLTLAQLGLQPRINEAYLLPFKNKKTNTYVCTPVIDYRGKIKLARQSGLVKDIEPHLVYANDSFDLRYSTDPQKRGLAHEPLLFRRDANGRMLRISEADRGELVLGYVIGWLIDADPHVEVMTYAEIDRIRQKAPGANSDAWVHHYDQQALKTLVHRIFKLLPWSGEKGAKVQKAQEIEDRVDMELGIDPIIELNPADDQPALEAGSTEEAQRIADQKIASETATAEPAEPAGGQEQHQDSSTLFDKPLGAPRPVPTSIDPNDGPSSRRGGWGKGGR